jgi:hypothetical protein
MSGRLDWKAVRRRLESRRPPGESGISKIELPPDPIKVLNRKRRQVDRKD